ncbi:MAG: sigma 54-interacting transcriptional regulator [Bacteriovoracaceae bacterium]|jgi:two-component system, NtrC family, nitrogen regulation response regulator NtrX|nr:sigma 54-interacting transcriptional regulator [Bacteriovoracaceae bacterium]
MTKQIQNKIRSFRIPIDSSDQVKLKVSKVEESSVLSSSNLLSSETGPQHYWFKIQDISLTGLSYITNSQLFKYSIDDKLKINLSFDDFHISVKAKVVRINKEKNYKFIAISYLFEEGQSFDLFFQKFIKTFDHNRVKKQLVSLLEDQKSSSYEYLSTMDLILNLNREVDQYSELDHFNYALLEQWRINMHADEIMSFMIDNEKNCSELLLKYEYLEKQHIVNVKGSVLEFSILNKSAFSAFILSDTAIADINKTCELQLSNILCSPIYENTKVIGILLLNRNNKSKFNTNDEKLIQQACSQFGTSLSKKEKIKKENIKFLNPHKPRTFALIGKDDKIQNLRRLIEGTKNDQIPVLLTGNPGTGKTLLAQIIHSEGRQSHRDFLFLNANRKSHLEKIKKLISTNKVPLEFNSFGTIYILNTNKLTQNDYNKLYENVLSSINEVRIILSPGEGTQCDDILPKRILKKIGNNRLHLPNLNDRKQDIPLLVKYLVKIECKKRGYLEKHIDDDVIKKFKQHTWVGNIREIKTAVGRLVEYFSHTNHIKKLPPDSYHIFTCNKNTDYMPHENIQKIIKSINTDNYSKDELSLLFQRELILIELSRFESNLKKTALSLGKPLEFIEEQLEKSSLLISKSKKLAS